MNGFAFAESARRRKRMVANGFGETKPYGIIAYMQNRPLKSRFSFVLGFIALCSVLMPVLPAAEAQKQLQHDDKRQAGSLFSLNASVSPHEFKVGEQFRVSVELINVSEKPIVIKCIFPWTVFPELWDASGKTRLPNAPSCAFDALRRASRAIKQEHRST